MATEKDNGGAAFPGVYYGEIPDVTHEGMSLRDYFAAKALTGMHARDSYDEGQATPSQRAAIAYLDADAMLAERAK